MANGVAAVAAAAAAASKPLTKPRKPQLPSLPKVKALYDYNPQDLDELELKEGVIVEVLKERKRIFFFLNVVL